jgi:copper chaperone CopZ
VDGVKNAVVDLEGSTAEVTLKNDVSDEVLSKVVADAGYEVTEIK